MRRGFLKQLKSLGSVFLMAMMLNLPLWNAALATAPVGPVLNQAPKVIEGGRISKTVQLVEGMINQWDITLKVEADKNIKSADTVLVIDRSGSMTTYSRIDRAKEAAKSLIAKLLYPGNTANRVAIVSFANDANINQGFTTDRNTAERAVNGLIAHGATFTQAAMRKASELIRSSNAEIKNVVFLSDGEPTYSYAIRDIASKEVTSLYFEPYEDLVIGKVYQTSSRIPQADFEYDRVSVGVGNSIRDKIEGVFVRKYYNHGNSAIAEAGFYKQAGLGKLYTIAFDAGPSGEAVLRKMATPGEAYSYETTSQNQDLVAIFEKIGDNINSAMSDVQVVDRMARGFEVVGIVDGAQNDFADRVTISNGGKTLTWGKFKPQLKGDKYVAELTYRVEPRQSLASSIPDVTGENGGFYSTNSLAEINYLHNDKHQTAVFPSPAVNPVFLTINKKVVDGFNSTRNDQYSFTLSGDGYEYIVKPGNNRFVVPARKQTSIVGLNETKLNGSKAALKQYNSQYQPNQYQYLTQTGDLNFVVTNTLKTIKINLHKQWLGAPAQQVVVDILANGQKMPKSVKMTKANQWQHQLIVPQYDRQGQIIEYKVQEQPIDGYQVPEYQYQSESDDSLKVTIINKAVSKKIKFTAKKNWQGGEKLNNGVRPTIKLQLFRNGQAQGAPVSLANGQTDYTWLDLDEADAGGQVYSYTVDELDVPQNYLKNVAGNVVTNTYQSPMQDITATKKWLNGPAPVLIGLQLYRNGQAVGASANLQPGSLSYTWKNQPLTDSQGKPYHYTVKEVNKPANYNDEYNGLEVTNRYIIPKKSVQATKKWIGGENWQGGRPAVWFKLYRYRDGQPLQAVSDAAVKKVEVNDKVTWAGIEQTDIQGNPYKFQVQEVDATGADFTPKNYTKQEQDLEVVNTYVSPKINIVVAKNWDGGQRRPQVSVNLKRDGRTISTANLHQYNDWKVKWTDQDLTDATGKKYQYSIEELDVQNYQAKISQTETDGELKFIVTNSYVSPKISVTGVKKWVGGEKLNNGVRPTIKLQLFRNGQAQGAPVSLANGQTDYTWSDLDSTDRNGREYVYSVDEMQGAANYDKVIAADRRTIINTYVPPVTSVQARKIWHNGSLIRPNVKLQLLRNGQPVVGQEIDLMPDVSGQASYIWKNLPATAQDGSAYIYTVKETTNFANWTANYDESRLVVTNTYQSPRLAISVKKQWIDNFTQHQPIKVELLRDQVALETVELNELNRWQYTWKVDQTDREGRDYQYQIREVGLPKYYRAVVEGDAKAGFVIKNIWNQPLPETNDLPEASPKPSDDLSQPIWQLPNTGYQTSVIDWSQLILSLFLLGVGTYSLKRYN